MSVFLPAGQSPWHRDDSSSHLLDTRLNNDRQPLTASSEPGTVLGILCAFSDVDCAKGFEVSIPVLQLGI